MKKYIAYFGLLIIALLIGCATNNKSNIYRFNEQHSVIIDIPEVWNVRIDGAETGSGVGYTLRINTDHNVRFLGLITILVANRPTDMTKEQLLSMIQEESNTYLLQAVEEKAVIVPIDLDNGYGAYYILTDASLVGKTPRSDEYKVFARFVIKYNNGALATITALMDDVECNEFKQFMESIMTMKPVF